MDPAARGVHGMRDEAFEAEIKGARPPLRGFTLSKAAWPWREGETAVGAHLGRQDCTPVFHLKY